MADKMDTDKVLETLQDALDAQGRSLLSMTVLAGTLRGVGGAAIKAQLREFVLAELEDTYHLIEKMSALGGTPRFEAGSVDLPRDTGRALQSLLEHETEAVAGMHAVIPHSGQEPRSEALEHLLEHIIMRQQQQVDFLWHAADLDDPLAHDPNG